MSWISDPVILSGHKVELLPLEPKHFSELISLAADKGIWKHYVLDASDKTVMLAALEKALQEKTAGRQYPFVIYHKAEQKLIGSTRFLDIQPQHRKLEIGWTWLHPDYWVGHINAECKWLLLTYCFDVLKTLRVQFKTNVFNTRSRKAIEKIGGRFEGILNYDLVQHNGARRDSVYYSITEDTWETKKTRLKQLAEQKYDAKKLLYRVATSADIPAMQALGVQSYGIHSAMLDSEHWDRMEVVLGAEKTYGKLLEVGTGFICEYDNRIAGMAFLIPSGNPTEMFQADWSYIRLLGVHPDFSGMGIGKHLMQQCIDKATETGESILALHTSEFMNAARHIYEKLGFRILKPIEPEFGKQYWIYTLILPDSIVNDKTNTAHYLWGRNCDSWIMADTPGLSVKQECMPADSSEMLHYHEQAQQCFFILDGEAAFYTGNQRSILRKWQSVLVKPGRRHRIANESGEPLEFLVISEPDTQNDRINV